MPDAFGMPFRTEQSAPRFTGDTCGLIQYAIKYNRSTDKLLWAGCPEAKGTSWLEFANEILWCYPEQGIDKYVRPDPPKSEISGPDGPNESKDYEVWTLQSESHEDTPVQELIEVEGSASEDFNATSDAPEEVRVSEISDLTFGQVQLPLEQLDSFVEVIYTEILTPEVIGTELTHLGDDGPEIPEMSAEDLSEISDIDIIIRFTNAFNTLVHRTPRLHFTSMKANDIFTLGKSYSPKPRNLGLHNTRKTRTYVHSLHIPASHILPRV
ncbi:uncharacterized protein HD556DRAFT_1487107 [Suillus plorans]|uniref:Uncharacterized protein n=1 Tax=Suillus plorans TaxID=116603 RepID=A0A9P7AL95_9AGAM|nr:uncharacterized protein HD556DRAFT_1487107 [Suillus plorans]KAG1790868.1 hypothetical protein HD556DRAFT_1487107 [Suillus plorans]